MLPTIDEQKKKDIFYTPISVIDQIVPYVWTSKFSPPFTHTNLMQNISITNTFMTPNSYFRKKYQQGISILEPAAGDGRILYALEKGIHLLTDQEQKCELVAVDKYYGSSDKEIGYRSDVRAYWKQDFLTLDSCGQFDLIVTNPPYSLATEFILKCYDCLAEYGEMWFLLRLDFLGSKNRYQRLYTTMPPTTIMVLSQRPSFTNDGATDAHNYAWFHWKKHNQQTTQVFWLP